MASTYARFAYRNLAAGATVTADAAATGLPATNLQDEQPATVWRTPSGVTSARLVCDLGSVQSVGAVLLLYTNLGVAATARVRLSASDPTALTGLAHDSGAVPAGVNPELDPDRHLIRWIEGHAAGRYLGIDIADATLTHLEAGVLSVGPYTELSRNYSSGFGHLTEARSELGESDGGQTYARRRPSREGARLTFRGITATEALREVRRINRQNGVDRPLLLCLDPSAAWPGEVSFWGHLREPADNDHWAGKYHTASFTIFKRL